MLQQAEAPGLIVQAVIFHFLEERCVIYPQCHSRGRPASGGISMGWNFYALDVQNGNLAKSRSEL